MNSFAQKSDIKVDSLSIFNPLNGHKIANFTKPVKLKKKLDSLNSIYKTNKFTLVSYFNNGDAVQCRVIKKDEPKKTILK